MRKELMKIESIKIKPIEIKLTSFHIILIEIDFMN